MKPRIVMPLVTLVVLGALVGLLAWRRHGMGAGGGPVITLAAEARRTAFELEGGEMEGPFEEFEDPGASGGKGIHIPENPDETERNPKTKTAEGEPAPWERVSKREFAGRALYPNGVARVRFSVKEAGEYVMWVRAYWLHPCANSFYFMIDPEEDPVDTDGNGEYDDEVIPKSFDGGGTCKVWHWVQYGGRGWGKKPETLKLSAGEHTMVIYNREDGIRLDQVLLVAYDPASEYYPTGIEKSEE